MVWRGGAIESVTRHKQVLQTDACTDTYDRAHVCRIHTPDGERIDDVIVKARGKHPEWELIIADDTPTEETPP